MTPTPNTDINPDAVLKRAREVFDIEIEGVNRVRESLGKDFIALVRLCLDTFRRGGKLVLTGVGKSGHISRKIAATLASTGARSVFMHPVEAMHGDLGIVSPLDAVLAVSYSGSTDELLRVVPAIKRMGVPIVAITGVPGSKLSEFSDLTVPMTIPREACPFNLAPTTPPPPWPPSATPWRWCCWTASTSISMILPATTPQAPSAGPSPSRSGISCALANMPPQSTPDAPSAKRCWP